MGLSRLDSSILVYPGLDSRFLGWIFVSWGLPGWILMPLELDSGLLVPLGLDSNLLCWILASWSLLGWILPS